MSEQILAANTTDRQQQRLAALRSELKERGLDGFLVPLADEHQGEYIPPRAQRLAWLTGFTGSAGIAVVLGDRAAVFSDGRYTLQLKNEINTELFSALQTPENQPGTWLSQQVTASQKIGFDPWLHTPETLDRLRAAIAGCAAELVACEHNPVDAVWVDQPPPPQGAVVVHPLEFAGIESSEKREQIATALNDQRIDAAVLTMPDSIAWLLNIRGADVQRSPITLSFAIVHSDARVEWFVDPKKLSPDVLDHLGNGVATAPPEDLGGRLDSLGNAGRKVLVDPSSAAAWIGERLRASGAQTIAGSDPCLLPKACKNAVEISGTRSAHIRDGIAVTRFLHWLAVKAKNNEVDELQAQERLEQLRREHATFRDLSFDTISGAGANGAVVHYRADTLSNLKLRDGSLYLVDSGGQYPDGTTDITRTIAIGQPTAEQRDRFTRVLKGHIALAAVRFPAGTSGSQLDILARHALWQVGLDYDHGTGHGVGSYLSVHEGPQRISKVANSVALRPGMIISNEPGYYKSGEFGIRIENLVVVEQAQDIPGGERPMHSFETLTLAPIDCSLIDTDLLNSAERNWLNTYHRRVQSTIGAALEDADEKRWLAEATQEL